MSWWKAAAAQLNCESFPQSKWKHKKRWMHMETQFDDRFFHFRKPLSLQLLFEITVLWAPRGIAWEIAQSSVKEASNFCFIVTSYWSRWTENATAKGWW